MNRKSQLYPDEVVRVYGKYAPLVRATSGTVTVVINGSQTNVPWSAVDWRDWPICKRVVHVNDPRLTCCK